MHSPKIDNMDASRHVVRYLTLTTIYGYMAIVTPIGVHILFPEDP